MAPSNSSHTETSSEINISRGVWLKKYGIYDVSTRYNEGPPIVRLTVAYVVMEYSVCKKLKINCEGKDELHKFIPLCYCYES